MDEDNYYIEDFIKTYFPQGNYYFFANEFLNNMVFENITKLSVYKFMKYIYIFESLADYWGHLVSDTGSLFYEYIDEEDHQFFFQLLEKYSESKFPFLSLVVNPNHNKNTLKKLLVKSLEYKHKYSDDLKKVAIKIYLLLEKESSIS